MNELKKLLKKIYEFEEPGQTLPPYNEKTKVPTGHAQANDPVVGNAYKADTPPPWLDENGNKKNDDELKEIVKTWKPSDWETYLSTLDVSQRELQLPPKKKLDELSYEDYTAALVDISELGSYPNLAGSVGRILSTLSERQRTIVKMRYWENRTLQEIGKILGIKYQSVQDSLRSSQQKIGKSLKKLAAKEACIDAVKKAADF